MGQGEREERKARRLGNWHQAVDAFPFAFAFK
jgi:hypothetical protein